MSIGTIISLFTGGMGLDLGFDSRDFEVKVCVEKDPWAVETIKANRPSIPVIPRDIHNVSTNEILETAGLGKGETTVLIGASPCQPFSTAGNRMSVQDQRSNTIDEFIRVVNETKPHFFVFEQVKGFMRAAKRHISFYERIGKRQEDLHPDERLGSAFDEIMSRLESTGYALSYDPHQPKKSVLNTADYGVPQKRERFILIGSRDGRPLTLPAKTHGAPDHLIEESEGLKPWVTLKEALLELQDPYPEHLGFTKSWGQYLVFVPLGGCWKDIPKELQKEALGGAYDDTNAKNKGGRTGFLRRLSWDKPAPTLVARPNTKACCLCHPDELRSLSVREYARIQSFPDDWVFKGSLSARYQLIGQATPVMLAQVVADVVIERLEEKEGQVANPPKETAAV